MKMASPVSVRHEDRFLGSLCRIAFVAMLGAGLVAGLLALYDRRLAVGVGAGAIISFLLFAANYRMTSALLAGARVPSRAMRWFTALSVLKYFVVAAAMWWLLRSQVMSPFTFAAALLVIPAALCVRGLRPDPVVAGSR
jgi:hypothetical protein